MSPLIECVPNFSNGRDPHIYNAIADAIRHVEGTHVLDVSADSDHNRTVITFVGTPDVVEEAAFRAIAEAAKHINLDQHEGEHPRIGATDVCPFIPLSGVTREECVALANRLGERVGTELGIAVYLYGDAATRPEREKLSAIRRGQYERWKEEVATHPERQPDFGPAEPKTWGATVIGVRPFLIAYNIYLNTDDVDIAEKISRTVRFSSGGLRFVQAKGFLVEGQAQVSMNLTNFEKTPIHVVQELVRREAARYGCTITKAELIGLTPEKAIVDAARWYLQLDDMRDDQVLEIRMRQDNHEEDGRSAFDRLIPHDFLDATADATPTPGGGSVAALVGALGAALAQMVAGLTVGRKKYADVQAETQAVLKDARQLRIELTTAIAEDATAFDAVMAAYRQKDVGEEEKATAVALATQRATEVPLEVARLGRDVAQLALTIARLGNVNAVSDAGAGAYMAQAAVNAADLNVRINAVNLPDQQQADIWRQEMDDLKQETAVLVENVSLVVAERGGF